MTAVPVRAPSPQTPTLARKRPTEKDLQYKLAVCKEQYRSQVQNRDSRECQLITLGQIGALQHALGVVPDPELPILCIM